MKQKKKQIRYSEKQIEQIVAFMRGGKTPREAKTKFGVSWHHADKLRKKFKVKKVEAVAKPTAKAKKKVKKTDLI